MREKYNTLTLATLRKLAKARGMKRISALNKTDLVDRMVEQDEIDERERNAAPVQQENKASDIPASKPEQPQKRQDVHSQAATVSAGQQKPGNMDTISQAQHKAGQRKPYPAPREKHGYITESSLDDRIRKEMETEHVSMSDLDSGEPADGILEVMQDGYGFIRCENYLPGENDVYVAPSQIRRFRLKTGDIIKGNKKIKGPKDKFSALLYVNLSAIELPSI